MKSLAILSLIFYFLSVSGQRIPVINDGNDNTPIAHKEFIVSLQLVRTEMEFFCAGVLVSRKTVLTLATCFYQNDVLIPPDEVRVVGGSQFRIDKELNKYSGILENIVIHENFSRSSLENNLAVAVLSVEVYKEIKNIEVFDLENIAVHSPVEGTKCEIFGWSLSTRLEGSPHLLSGEVQIETREKCDDKTNKITSATLCAGPYFVNGCETDDGSPLICNGKLHGLIDYRPIQYCSEIVATRLGTYIDLSKFHDWIAQHAASGRAIVSWATLLTLCLIVRSFNYMI